MVSNANQTTLDSPVNQGVHADTSEPNKIGASTPYDFEARNLTAYGGLLPVATMLEKLGFQQLVEETLTAPHAPASPPTRTRRLQRQAHQRPHQGHRRRALLLPRRRRVPRQPARPSPSSTAASRPTWPTASKPSSATAKDQLRPHYRCPLVVIPEGNLLLCRQFRWRRIVVLLAPHVAVVHDRALEQLVPPIVELPPMLAQLSHLLLPQRLEVMQNRKILIQHRHRVHTRYGRRNARHAHRIRQRLRRGHRAMHNGLAGAAHALHREHGHLLRHRNRQHVLLKRPEAWIERIHRKLHRVECKPAVQ